MKKSLGLLIMILFVSLSTSAQAKFENAAKEVVDEMVKELSITEDQQKQVYEAELAKNIAIGEIRVKHAGDQETIKQKVTEENIKTNKIKTEILGERKMKEWRVYSKAKRAKK